MNRLTLLVVALAISGCGLSQTVDRDLLREITIENKLLLFDAENDVAIALDERERIMQDIREAKQDIDDAESQIREAESDRARADQKGEAEKEKLAQMAAEVFDLKVDYLEGHVDFLRERFAAQEGLVMVVRAKFELAKAKLVKKNNVRGASDVDLEDFEAQVESYVNAARADQEELAEQRQALLEIRKLWLVRRDELQKASGGGLGSPWAEESSLWGGK